MDNLNLSLKISSFNGPGESVKKGLHSVDVLSHIWAPCWDQVRASFGPHL